MERNTVSKSGDSDNEESVHTMLLSALEQNDEQTLQVLLSSGAAVNSRDELVNTALHDAAKLGHALSRHFFVQNGVEVNSQNDAITTPLFLASRGNQHTVQFLIRLGGDVALRNHLGEIPLHATSRSSLVDVIIERMTSGSDVNTSSRPGLTPQCVAINSGGRNAVKTVLRFGANLNNSLLHPDSYRGADRSEKAGPEEERPQLHHVRVRVPGAAGQQHQRGPQGHGSPRVVGHPLRHGANAHPRTGGFDSNVLPSLPRHLGPLVHPPRTQCLHRHHSPHPQSVRGAHRVGGHSGGVFNRDLPLHVGSSPPLGSSPAHVSQQGDGVERGLNADRQAASSPPSEAVSTACLCHPVSTSSCSPCLVPVAFSDSSLLQQHAASTPDYATDLLEEFHTVSENKPSPSEIIECQSCLLDKLSVRDLSTREQRCTHMTMEETASEKMQHGSITHPQYYDRTGPRLSKDSQLLDTPFEALDAICHSEEETKLFKTPLLPSMHCDGTDLSAADNDFAENKVCTNEDIFNACESATPVQTEKCLPGIQTSPNLSNSAMKNNPKPSSFVATMSYTNSSATAASNIQTLKREKEGPDKQHESRAKQFRGVTFRQIAEDSSASMNKTVVVDLATKVPATSEASRDCEFESCSKVILVRPKATSDLGEASLLMEEVKPETAEPLESTTTEPGLTALGAAKGPATTMPLVETAPASEDLHDLESPKTEVKGFTALHRAAQLGMETVCQALLDSGAEVNARTARGETPLHLAAKFASTGGRGDTGELVRLLVRAGADVGAVTSSGETALHLAALVGDALMASVLISEGADVRLKDLAGNTPLHQACQRIVSLEAQRVRTVRVLLSSGARADEVNRHGLTPLHLLLLHRDDGIDLDVVRVLVSYKADPNRFTGSGEHPLLLALQNRLFSFAGVLVEKGADPNVVGEGDGKTPMHHACKEARVQLFKLLWAKGGDPTKVDCKGFTPLRYAVESGSEAMVRTCVDTGASTCQHFTTDLLSLHLDPRNPPSLSELFESSSATQSPFLYAFLHAQTAVLALLYNSGCFSFSEILMLKVVCEKLNLEGLPETQRDAVLFVLEINHSPPSLQNLCRWKISHLIGCCAERKMRTRELNLPTMLRNFVLFVDDV